MPRPLDHLVLTVTDLDIAAERYRALGFTVGAQNRHPFGTINRLVMLEDTFLELITVPEDADIPDEEEGNFSIATFVRDFIQREGEGFAMVALKSSDAEADRAKFEADGIGSFDTFRFERQGKGADGQPVTVGFTLAFAVTPTIPDAGFFVCQHHAPERLWHGGHAPHRNGAQRLVGVALVADNPADHYAFLEAFTGVRSLRATSNGIAADLPEGCIDILTPAAFEARYGEAFDVAAVTGPRLGAFRVRIGDLAVARGVLEASGLPSSLRHGALVVPARCAFGPVIAFETV